eukprot:scaffold3377_cov105-Isochrysis_galbana.AAC.5
MRVGTRRARCKMRRVYEIATEGKAGAAGHRRPPAAPHGPAGTRGSPRIRAVNRARHGTAQCAACRRGGCGWSASGARALRRGPGTRAARTGSRGR